MAEQKVSSSKADKAVKAKQEDEVVKVAVVQAPAPESESGLDAKSEKIQDEAKAESIETAKESASPVVDLSEQVAPEPTEKELLAHEEVEDFDGDAKKEIKRLQDENASGTVSSNRQVDNQAKIDELYRSINQKDPL